MGTLFLIIVYSLITTLGHSLGGGVGAVFSYLLTRFYPKTVEYGEQRIRAVLFAQPPAGTIRIVRRLFEMLLF